MGTAAKHIGLDTEAGRTPGSAAVPAIRIRRAPRTETGLQLTASGFLLRKVYGRLQLQQPSQFVWNASDTSSNVANSSFS